MSEKPLHIRVAEALGCNPVRHPSDWACQCPGANRGDAHGDIISVYRYDTDWSATGPLIERFGITLEYLPCDKHEGCEYLSWDAYASQRGPIESGTTALRAVCDLILALSEAGELEAK